MLQNIWVIIGCLVGAGFASGKEIYLFFYQYGLIGIIGILIASLLFFLVIRKCFCFVDWNKKQNKEIKNYRDFLREIFKSKKGKKDGSEAINGMINLFMLIEFFIMVAGFGAYLNQVFDIPVFIGAGIISLCTYLTCKKSMKGIEKANKFVIPLLIIYIIYIGVQNVDNVPGNLINLGDIFLQKQNTFQMILYAILYASYNSILLIPVLIGLNREKGKKENNKIAFLSSVIIGILAICIFRVLGMGSMQDLNNDIPMVKISEYYGFWQSKIYGLMIGISIYTSAIAICFGLMENLPVIQGKSYNRTLMIICIISIFVSFIGFSNLVEKIYPLLGIFGIVQTFKLLRYKCKETIEKKAKMI